MKSIVNKQGKDGNDKLEVHSVDNQEMEDVDKSQGSELDDSKENTECDFGAPKLSQVYRSKTIMLLSVSWCTFTQSMLSVGFVKSVLTSLERRFGFTSMESGAVVTFNTVGALLSVLLFTCFGGETRRLRCLSYCMVIMSIGSFIFSLPHFAISHYEYMAPIQPVCYREGNVSYGDICKLEDNMQPRFHRFIFWLSSVLIGIGTTPLYLHCILYIDDNTNVKESPLYIGAIYSSTVLGPVAGYLMSAFFLQMLFVDVSSSHPGLTTADRSSWVGAWWIGFLISGVMFLLAVPVLFLFPKEMPGAAAVRAEKSHPPLGASEPITDALSLKRGRFSKRARRVMLNPTFVCLGLSGLATNLIISGMTAFGPKYLEVAFGFSPAEAAQMFGFMFVPIGAGGTVIGGVLMNRFSASLRKMLQFQALLSLTCPPLVVLAFLAPCESQGGNERWAGITVPYNDKSTALSLNASCNSNCHCSNNYLLYSPLCGKDGMNYLSPCYAGCDTVYDNQNAQCACIKFNESNSQGQTAHHAKRHAPCKPRCRDAPLFVIPFAVLVLLTFILATPRLASIMRSVPQQQKSLAFGIQWLIVRFAGSVPGPIAMGAAFDVSCVLWKQSCEGRGSCYLYNPNRLKYVLMAICVVSQTFVSFSLFLAWYFQRFTESKMEEEDVVISVKLQSSETNNACNNNAAHHRDNAIYHTFGLFPFSLR